MARLAAAAGLRQDGLVKTSALFLAALAALVFTVSCSKEVAPPPVPQTIQIGGTNAQVFQVKGTVVELKLAANTVRIKHEEIPGYMPAMTMPFEVKDLRELGKLEAGDPVSFRMIVTENDAWIDQVKKLNAPVNTNLPTTGPFRVVRDVDPLEIGDLLPDYRFTNQLGQAVNLHQFRGTALAITFIFTRCPLPTYCPLMSSNFRDTQEALLRIPNAPTNWHLLTISFDPEFDTPARLKGYAETYRHDPRRWSFLTGELIDITAIAEQFGMLFWRDQEGSISHNLRTVVVDANGRVQANLAENKWTSEQLVEEIVKATRAGR